jgi:hypothetical protein
MSEMFYNSPSITSVPLLNTSNVTKMNTIFYNTKITTIPQFNTSNVDNMQSFLMSCAELTSVPLLNTSNVTNFQNAFSGCSKLTTIPALDTRKASILNYIFQQCYQLKTILMYGMKVSFDISPSTQFEASDLVTIMSNCQVVTSSQKLTMGSTNLAKLDGVYVKETGVEPYEGITLRPCVICESTDEGAMLATDYFTAKGWTLA